MTERMAKSGGTNIGMKSFALRTLSSEDLGCLCILYFFVCISFTKINEMSKCSVDGQCFVN